MRLIKKAHFLIDQNMQKETLVSTIIVLDFLSVREETSIECQYGWSSNVLRLVLKSVHSISQLRCPILFKKMICE